MSTQLERGVYATRRAMVLGGLAASALPIQVSADPVAHSDHGVGDALATVERLSKVSQAADDVCDAAWDRFMKLGGEPALPEAIFRREGDSKLGIYHTERLLLIGEDRECRFHVSADSLPYLRRTKFTRIVDDRRPVTIADGFTEAEVAAGGHVICKSRHVPWSEAQARADEIVAAWDAMQAEKRRRLQVSGADEASDAAEAAYNTYEDARRALTATKSRNVEGVMQKAAYVLQLFAGEPQTLSASIATGKHTIDQRLALSIVRDLLAFSDQGAGA